MIQEDNDTYDFLNDTEKLFFLLLMVKTAKEITLHVGLDYPQVRHVLSLFFFWVLSLLLKARVDLKKT